MGEDGFFFAFLHLGNSLVYSMPKGQKNNTRRCTMNVHPPSHRSLLPISYRPFLMSIHSPLLLAAFLNGKMPKNEKEKRWEGGQEEECPI
jgi:hypothetical protein